MNLTEQTNELLKGCEKAQMIYKKDCYVETLCCGLNKTLCPDCRVRTEGALKMLEAVKELIINSPEEKIKSVKIPDEFLLIPLDISIQRLQEALG